MGMGSCGGNHGWPSINMWAPMAAVLDAWRPPGEYRELINTPKCVVELLAAIIVKKEARQ